MASRLAKRDEADLAKLWQAHDRHRRYGVRRLALHLGWSVNKTRRLMRQAGITVTVRKKAWRPSVRKPEIQAPANALAPFTDQTMSDAWVQDFTYLYFQGAWLYLAVVLDLRTRQIVGWQLGTRHTSELTFEALLDALSKHPPPVILHSDQGSEYLSQKHRLLCDKLEVTLSCSDRGSPWQNGYLESFFGRFKDDLGPLSRFAGLPELHEGVALAIHYYNTQRIHTSLKMSPAAYAAQLKRQAAVSDNVLQKVGA
jgi:putative transposase